MKNPRTPGAGITGASTSLGSDQFGAFIAGAGASFNRFSVASALDREADALLFLGQHARAERLAHRAAEMRQAALS
jgi:hypothetical protein